MFRELLGKKGRIRGNFEKQINVRKSVREIKDELGEAMERLGKD